MTTFEELPIRGAMAAARRSDLEAATLDLVRHVGGGRALLAALVEARQARVRQQNARARRPILREAAE